MTQDGRIANLIAELLKELGEDTGREGLDRTPARVEKALRYFTSGYSQDVKEVLNGALFVEDYDEMVIVKDIDFSSMCEHHLLPFVGKCHVAYLPNRKIVGLSKIPRLVEMFSRRLQVQERLTTQVANTLNDALQPLLCLIGDHAVQRTELGCRIAVLDLRAIAPPLLRPSTIDEQAPLDREQPRSKRALAAKSIDRGKGPDERVLHKLVDLVAFA
jgi:GTP cyclohydrolase I